MQQSKPIKSLDDLMNGAAVQRFNKCMREVLMNIFDPNTDAKKTRKITMTFGNQIPGQISIEDTTTDDDQPHSVTPFVVGGRR